MKKRFLHFLFALALCVSLFTVMTLAADGVAYLDENGTRQSCTSYTEVTSDMSTTWNTGWYVVKHDVTINGSITGSNYAQIDLILCDGATLTVKGGLTSHTLRIYGQSGGTGKLVASGGRMVDDGDPYLFGLLAKKLTINGGVVEATGGQFTTTANSEAETRYAYSTGICLFAFNTSGELTINGGRVTATGGSLSGEKTILCETHGIYVKSNREALLTVNDGEVRAYGGVIGDQAMDCDSNGIYLYASADDKAKMTVDGGKVYAYGGAVSGGSRAKAIGIFVQGTYTPDYKADAVLQINDGRVEATGGSSNDAASEVRSYGIHVYGNGDDATLTIAKATVTATGGNVVTGNSYGIYVNAYDCNDAELTINSGLVNAHGGNISDGRTRGMYLCADESGKVSFTVKNGTVRTKGGNVSGVDASGESQGIYVNADYKATVTIKGGQITATGGNVSGADASGDSYGFYIESDLSDAKMTIEDGSVTATGGSISGADASGDSIGFYIEADDDATVTMEDGQIKATGGSVELYSGDGEEASRVQGDSYGFRMKADDYKTLTLNGGKLVATGGNVTLRSIHRLESYSLKVYGKSVGLGCEDLTVNGGSLKATSGDTDITILSGEAAGEGDKAESYGLNVSSLKLYSGSVRATAGKATLTAASGTGEVKSWGIRVGNSSRSTVSGGYLCAKTMQTDGRAIGSTASSYKLDLTDYQTYFWRVSSQDAFTAFPTTAYAYDAAQTFIEISPDGISHDQDEDEEEDKTPADAADDLAWLTPVIGALNAEQFADVSVGDWFYDAVHYVNEYGLMTGTSANGFSPNAPVTRGMVMTILARREGIKTDRYSPWYAAGVEWAKSVGISDGTNPEEAITREQLAVMLYRYAQYKGYDMNKLAELAFTDAAEISDYATIGLRWAVGSGLMSGAAGLESGKLLPQSTATRAQLATILHRLFG